MPNTSDQSTRGLPVAVVLPISVAKKEQSESAIIASFVKGFDGHKKFLDVLRGLDGEIAGLNRQECFFVVPIRKAISSGIRHSSSGGRDLIFQPRRNSFETRSVSSLDLGGEGELHDPAHLR